MTLEMVQTRVASEKEKRCHIESTTLDDATRGYIEGEYRKLT